MLHVLVMKSLPDLGPYHVSLDISSRQLYPCQKGSGVMILVHFLLISHVSRP